MVLLAALLPLGACADPTARTADAADADSTTVRDGDVVVHFIGLERWTPAMIRDSLARVAPGVSLSDAACAVVLRERLGFAQAAVESRTDRGLAGASHTVVISVVEPSDSARVRLLPAAADTAPTRSEWQHALDLMRRADEPLRFLQFADFFYDGRVPAVAGADSATRALRDEIERVAKRPDALRDAREAVLFDGNRDNREMGALVLAHFPTEPSAWWTLARSLLRGEDTPTRVAEVALGVMKERAPDGLDWGPAADALHALASGTNLSAFLGVLEVLTATRIDPGLGRTLIEPAYPYLRGNLTAPIEDRRRIVRGFLARVTGRDPGDDDAAWVRWLDDFLAAARDRQTRGRDVAAAYAASLGDSVLTRWGACPYECCVYREWTAESDVPLRGEPDSAAAVIASFRPGESFDADTGFVRVTAPEVVVMTDTVGAYGTVAGGGGDGGILLQPGDTLLLLSYAGEGYWNAARGADRVQVPEVWTGDDGAPYGGVRAERLGDYDSEWWVHGRAADGREGWFRSDRVDIGHADACGAD